MKKTASKKDAFQQSGSSPTKSTKTQITLQRYPNATLIRRLEGPVLIIRVSSGGLAKPHQFCSLESSGCTALHARSSYTARRKAPTFVTCKDCRSVVTRVEVRDYRAQCTLCWALNFVLRAQYHIIAQDRLRGSNDAPDAWNILARALSLLIPTLER